jgi:hypothetical protein
MADRNRGPEGEVPRTPVLPALSFEVLEVALSTF